MEPSCPGTQLPSHPADVAPSCRATLLSWHPQGVRCSAAATLLPATLLPWHAAAVQPRCRGTHKLYEVVQLPPCCLPPCYRGTHRVQSVHFFPHRRFHCAHRGSVSKQHSKVTVEIEMFSLEFGPCILYNNIVVWFVKLAYIVVFCYVYYTIYMNVTWYSCYILCATVRHILMKIYPNNMYALCS